MGYKYIKIFSISVLVVRGYKARPSFLVIYIYKDIISSLVTRAMESSGLGTESEF